MIIKGLIDEDFVQYKKPSMTILFPSCSFKCEKECGEKVCQNSTLSVAKEISIDTMSLVNRYINNSISQAIVCSGLEPFDSWNDLYQLISNFRKVTDDDIIIYSGYNREEIEDKIKHLVQFKNIFIKYGRFVPMQKKHYDETLGVYLASDGQYAEKIS